MTMLINPSGQHHPVEIVGYAPREGIFDPEVLALYSDYPVGRKMALDQFRYDLDFGNAPAGLLVRIGGGKVAIVKGSSNNLFVEAV